jgi:uncharacterized protein YidB (DUF937 family)
MTLFENITSAIKGVFGQVDENSASGLLSTVLSRTNLGDLQGIVSKLEAAGLGDQVKSWLGNGSNLPITAEQLRAALGNEQVQQMAHHLGLPVDEALNFLAKVVPTAVDSASPNGTLSSPSA